MSNFPCFTVFTDAYNTPIISNSILIKFIVFFQLVNDIICKIFRKEKFFTYFTLHLGMKIRTFSKRRAPL